MKIKQLSLRNITCFEKLDLEFKNTGTSALLLGDNGDGKSTVLRCLAMGLCDSSSASALFREVAGPFVRRDSAGRSAESGTIQLDLEDDGVIFRTTTLIKPVLDFEAVTQTLERIEGGKHEEVQIESFPWDRIFAVGYGAGLRTDGSTSYDRYSAVDAVYTLFMYEYPLQSPEVILWRLRSAARESADSRDGKDENERIVWSGIQQLMAELLDLDGPECFQLTPKGLLVEGFWGTASLNQLGDGYQATITWVLDLISWWFLREGISGSGNWSLTSIEGIAIVDEMEQHLHPKWQHRMLPSLRERFPNIQFIVATHSPLVASGSGDVQVHLFQKGQHELIEPYGWLAENVYQRMGLPDSRSDQFDEDIVGRYEQLDLKRLENKASEAETEEWKRLRAILAALPEDDVVALSVRLDNIMKSGEPEE